MCVFFFTEASLSGVEALMQNVQGEIGKVDNKILTAVRQQVSYFFSFFLSLHCMHKENHFFFCVERIIYGSESYSLGWLIILQSNSGTKAKEDLADATRAVEVSFS